MKGYKNHWFTEQQVADMYVGGLTAQQIAKNIQWDQGRVRQAIRSCGVTIVLRARVPRNHNILRPLAERFWERVERGEPDECWMWKGANDLAGYGIIGNGNGKRLRAARVAFFLAHGRWPKVARHTCDTPGCCNAAHILDGTLADNNRDKTERGRDCRGSAHGQAKLTESDVLEIRTLIGLCTARAIAREYGVSDTAILAIKKEKTWQWLT